MDSSFYNMTLSLVLVKAKHDQLIRHLHGCEKATNMLLICTLVGLVKIMKLPKCHGELETVFPMGEDGLRASPEKCLECRHKTTCLRTALAGPRGISLKDERVDNAYNSGQMGFMERWSRKKTLHRSMKNKK